MFLGSFVLFNLQGTFAALPGECQLDDSITDIHSCQELFSFLFKFLMSVSLGLSPERLSILAEIHRNVKKFRT